MARIKDRARQEIRSSAEAAEKISVFRTATYARLSVDSAVTESSSIASQQMLMRDYIKGKDEFFLVHEYKDDGITGTRFERQEFDSLIAEVRKGNINCIIVKDFSRFGRDHIEVGNYLEKVFPFLGVRFISVNDDYDSFDQDSREKKLAVVLKNLVNEYVARDTSTKVTSSYVTKQENGEYDGGCAPYGYVFADKRKTGFLLDEKPAEVIRNIFAWTMQGDSTPAIVRRLTERRINPPKVYQDTGEFYRQERERCYWNECTVCGILENMVYAGHMALHKWKESKADGIGPYKLDVSEWKVTRNTHQAIITEHDFRLVQEILRTRKEWYKSQCGMDNNIIRPENLLKGKVFCGDCLVPASRMGANYLRKTGKIRIYRYRCRTYRGKGKNECSSKSISEKSLEALVYRAVIVFICQVENLDSMILRFHHELFQKMYRSLAKEKDMVERAILKEQNEKILLYKEYSSRARNAKHSNIEQACKKRISNNDKEWYLKEKQKKEKEIRYQEERKVQVEEKTAFFEWLENKQAGWIKDILSCNVMNGKGLTAQMVSIFVQKIFLYDGKRVEVVLNFNDEYQTRSCSVRQFMDKSLYSHAHTGQVRGNEEGRA